MATQHTSHTSSKALHAVAGALLLSLGVALLLSNFDNIAALGGNAFSSTADSFGTVMQLGLTAMRAVQTYYFEPATFEAGVQLILISFWPLILVIIGATLLQSAIGKRFANSMARTYAPEEYDDER